jgi:hypothetical protein
MTWRAFAFALLLVLSMNISPRFIYEPWVVPHLAQFQSVPVLWWVVVYLPQFLVCCLAGLVLRHWSEAAVFSCVGALLLTCVALYLQSEHRPGYINGSGILGSPLTFLVYLVVVYAITSLVHLLRSWTLIRARRI